MRERPSPSRPFASAPNRAGPTRLFASVRQSLPTRSAANEPVALCDHGRDDEASLDDAAAHRAAFAVDEHPDCHVAQHDAAAHGAALAHDEPRGSSHVAQGNFRGEGDAPKDCARAKAAHTASSYMLKCIAQPPTGFPGHADAADAGPDRGAIAAFVELVHLDALLAAEARFLKSSVTAVEQPKRLQHDHVLVEARWRAGVVARCQGRRTAKLQSVTADSFKS